MQCPKWDNKDITNMAKIGKTLPVDQNGNILPIVPAVTALAVTYDPTISAATDISLNSGTTFIEVNAINDGVFLRYAATASSTNFDEYIAKDTVRHYARPASVTTISVIDSGNTGAVVIIEK